jgi:hypothetical protein
MKAIQTIIFLVLINSIYAQTTVHLSILEEGRGLLRSRGNECFVIAPYHLFDGAENRNIVITGDNQKISQGKYIKQYPGDIAIIKIEGGAAQECTEWNIVKSFTPLLKNTIDGFLEIRNDDGSLDHEPMYLKRKTDQGITIQAKDANFEFSKGMSGSSLFTLAKSKKIYLGMLMSADSSNSKIGNIFDAKYMDNIIGDFFDLDSKKNHVKPYLIPSTGLILGTGSIAFGYLNYYKKANNIYDSYEKYQTENLFKSNVEGFESRSSAYKEAESLRKKAVVFQVIGGIVFVTAGILFYNKMKDSRVKVGASENGISLTYNLSR